MKQYLELLKAIKEKGTYKPAARENMPGTQSLFGYQFRHNLADGFPLLTTKKMFWKGVVIELLWFLRGDTNIKYLVDNGVNIWTEDSYSYYLKKCKEQNCKVIYSFEDFEYQIKNRSFEQLMNIGNEVKEFSGNGNYPEHYEFGDCGYQYGKVWRDWETETGYRCTWVDQIKVLIEGLKNNPESRRHIVTSIDPGHQNDLALYWCHAMFQFNCRPLTIDERLQIAKDRSLMVFSDGNELLSKRSCMLVEGLDEFEKRIGKNWIVWLEEKGISGNNINAVRSAKMDVYEVPKYYLDCQLYQRSADVFLGVPFNIASYALLTELIAKICNMIPGEFIHTFGDVHIYDNHKEAVEEQLKREPTELPKLKIMFKDLHECSFETIDEVFKKANETDFQLINYNPQSAIKAELSTGIKK